MSSLGGISFLGSISSIRRMVEGCVLKEESSEFRIYILARTDSGIVVVRRKCPSIRRVK